MEKLSFNIQKITSENCKIVWLASSLKAESPYYFVHTDENYGVVIDEVILASVQVFKRKLKIFIFQNK